MLIPKRFWEPIRAGAVTVAFRRWSCPRVVAGRTYRTAAGRLEVTAVTVVDPAAITDAEARRAGYDSAENAMAGLRGEAGDPVFRIEFRHLDEPDPRDVLASTSDLTSDDVAELDRRLARYDHSAPHGPWTIAYLEAIAAHPERRAPDLATMFGRETQPFKRDVRKLKNLGLTISLRIGYRLSPRGAAYLAAKRDT